MTRQPLPAQKPKAHQQKLAEALRANMTKRKQQAAARGTSAPAPIKAQKSNEGKK